MEDLRKPKTLIKESGKVKKVKLSIKIELFLNKLYLRIINFIKYYKYLCIFIVLLLFFIFPRQIGDFLGDWSYIFYTEITKNFK